MNDTTRDYATADADVLYIGYPKSASVFVGKFLEGHPEVTTDHNRIAPLLLHANWSEYVASARPAGSKVHVCRDESVAE
jgi:hypothetical protein